MGLARAVALFVWFAAARGAGAGSSRLPDGTGWHQRRLRVEAAARAEQEDAPSRQNATEEAEAGVPAQDEGWLPWAYGVLKRVLGALSQRPLAVLEAIFNGQFASEVAGDRAAEGHHETRVLEEPPMERIRNLASVAAALSRYEEHLDSNSPKREQRYAEDKDAARDVLHDMARKIEKNRPISNVEGQFHILEEVLSNNAAAKFLSAEAAIAGGEMILTANDIAQVEGGIRGEDVGPAGTLPSFQGDMVAESKVQLGLLEFHVNEAALAGSNSSAKVSQIAAGKPWSGARVNYCFASDVQARTRHMFEAATHQYEKAVPCLNFADVGLKNGASNSPAAKQRCNKEPAIFVTSEPGQGCFSYVGMMDQLPSQRVQLNDPSCTSIGTALHELGHALGMAHEQSRPDRDKHVRVLWENVQADKKHNFVVVPESFVGEKYDYLSIMHYDAFAFTLDNKKATIEAIDVGQHSQIGQRVGLSEYDVKQVALMYAEEAAECESHALDGLGCIDKPGGDGGDVCSGVTSCAGDTIRNCCACGGGVKVQCYVGSDCPGRGLKMLPEPSAADCITDATHIFAAQGVPCVIKNECSFKVKWSCPLSAACEYTADPKAYVAPGCQGRAATQICTGAIACSVSKV